MPLVKDNTTGVWKPVSDNGTRVEQKFGADNGDDNGEYWLVTTPDGTKYHFGLNHLPGWASGNPTTDSVFTVPVFGNQANEPCHQATYENSACTQAWRWNLDYVEDTHANAMALYWKQEKNHYAQAGKTDQPKAYVRGGWLDRIEYGLRADSVYSRPAPAKVTFVVDERCLRTPEFDCSDAKFTKHSTDGLNWPDVPVDSLCKDTGKCYMSGPTFWTRKWLATVRTEVATAPGANTYRPVDSFELKHNFLAARVDTNPPAWLDSIRRTGHAADGTIASLPPVTFHANAVNMPNRQTGPGDPARRSCASASKRSSPEPAAASPSPTPPPTRSAAPAPPNLFRKRTLRAVSPSIGHPTVKTTRRSSGSTSTSSKRSPKKTSSPNHHPVPLPRRRRLGQGRQRIQQADRAHLERLARLWTRPNCHWQD